jgi:hypothetical protein
MMKGVLVVCVGMLLFRLIATGGEPGDWRPGRFDEHAVQLLKEATEKLKLGKTTILEVAPKYFVEKGGDLSWEEAVAKADRLFGEDADKRALFLRKFLPAGSPSARLEALKLPDMGLQLETGGGRSSTYGIGVTYEQLGQIRRRNAKASLMFVYGQDKTLQPPTLCIEDVELGGNHYKLYFDVDDKLTGFSREGIEVAAESTIRVGGNTSGAGGTNYFFAGVTSKNGAHESVDFTPSLVIWRRRVDESQAGKPIYAETYEDGKLRKRVYYGERKSASGTQSFIERTEEFNPPPPKTP